MFPSENCRFLRQISKVIKKLREQFAKLIFWWHFKCLPCSFFVYENCYKRIALLCFFSRGCDDYTKFNMNFSLNSIIDFSINAICNFIQNKRNENKISLSLIIWMEQKIKLVCLLWDFKIELFSYGTMYISLIQIEIYVVTNIAINL